MSSPEHMYSTTEDEMFCFLLLKDKHGNTLYSNLTGWFQAESYAGMNYIVICMLCLQS